MSACRCAQVSRPRTSDDRKVSLRCQPQIPIVALLGGREDRVWVSESRWKLRGVQHRRKQVSIGNSHSVSKPKGFRLEVHDPRGI